MQGPRARPALAAGDHPVDFRPLDADELSPDMALATTPDALQRRASGSGFNPVEAKQRVDHTVIELVRFGDPCQIERPQQRLAGEEAHSGGGGEKMRDALVGGGLVLDADAEPDV